MAGFDYQNAQKVALDLIGQFGQEVKMMRISGEYDPTTGEQPNRVLETTKATVVSLPTTNGLGLSGDNRFKEDLKQGKIRGFYVAAKGLSFDPQAGDLLGFEGGVWDIAGATPLNPAGTPVLFTVGCRSSGKFDWDEFRLNVDAFEAEMAKFGSGNEHDLE